MIISVHQPQYIPWLGYFEKIARSDGFVFLDRVQYKAREFQNRNKIRTKDGWLWLTVPVLKNARAYPALDTVYIDNAQDWQRRHWRAIFLNYAKAPFFKEYSDWCADLYRKEWKKLSELNIYIIKSVNEFLGINTKIYNESQFKIGTKSTQRIIDICKKLKADTYLSGIGGKEYLDEQLFGLNNIKLNYQNFKHPQYQQCYKPFIPYMSIIDLLFNCGPEALKTLLGK